mgnify:FL=1
MASNYNLNPVPWHPMFGGPEWATPAPFQAPSFNAGGAQQPFNPITGPGIPFPEGPSMLGPSQGGGGQQGGGLGGAGLISMLPAAGFAADWMQGGFGSTGPGRLWNALTGSGSTAGAGAGGLGFGGMSSNALGAAGFGDV